MKRYTRLFFILAPTFGLSAWAQPAAVQMNEFVEAWKATRAYTIAVAEAMPAESYAFKPTPGEFTFAAQMIHLAHANYAWFAGIADEKRTIADPKGEDKASVLPYLKQTFDYCIGVPGTDHRRPVEPDRARCGRPEERHGPRRPAQHVYACGPSSRAGDRVLEAEGRETAGLLVLENRAAKHTGIPAANTCECLRAPKLLIWKGSCLAHALP